MPNGPARFERATSSSCRLLLGYLESKAAATRVPSRVTPSGSTRTRSSSDGGVSERDTRSVVWPVRPVSTSLALAGRDQSVNQLKDGLLIGRRQVRNRLEALMTRATELADPCRGAKWTAVRTRYSIPTVQRGSIGRWT